MSFDGFLRRRNVDAETLNALLSTQWVVHRRPSAYSTNKSFMRGSVASKRDDPADSNIGLRLVVGNASGEARYHTNRPGGNISPAQIAEEMDDHDAQVYVPITWVLRALRFDSLDEFAADPHAPET